jgi:hypothetical protein
MADKTFKIGDRVRHIKLGRVGQVTYIYTAKLLDEPGIRKLVYRIKFDNSPSTVDVLESELERE